jgi:ankyrin repeat protein
LLIGQKANARARNKLGESLGWQACKMGHVKVLHVLLGHDTHFLESSMSRKTFSARGPFAQFHVHTRCNRGKTPAMVASENGHVECLKILIEEKADVDAGDLEGKTPVCRASRYGSVECVRALLEAKADLSSFTTRHAPTYPGWRGRPGV